MTSNRSYLIRALNEWILENDMTPHIAVDADAEGVDVPAHTIQESKLVLNISPVAVQALMLGNDLITFSARFGGASYHISIPVKAVLAIYAKETGKGMIFPDEELDEKSSTKSAKANDKKVRLKVVK